MKREKIDTYTALIVQPEVTVVEDRAGIKKNLDRVCNLIHFGVGYYWEVPVKLVVLPEYFMQGVGTPGKGESGIKDQMKKAVTIPIRDLLRNNTRTRLPGATCTPGGMR